MTISTSDDGRPDRDIMMAALNGMRGHCPHCGKGKLFAAFLKVDNNCPNCNEALYHHRADDAPPYVVITIVGHIVVGGMLFVEKTYAPDLWIHVAIWIPMTIILSLVLLPPVKGALIGVQWALRMHGFDPDSPEAGEAPPAMAPVRQR